MKNLLLLGSLLVLCVGGGALIGAGNTPDGWYEALAKPWFNPPNWIFGPVWTVLYIMIAVAGWRTFRRDGATAAKAAWIAQLVFNFSWSPSFFTLHAIGLALAASLAMLAAIVFFIALTWRPDRTSALLFVPYAAWVAFATLLTASIFWLN